MTELKEVRITGLPNFNDVRIIPKRKENTLFYAIDEIFADGGHKEWATYFLTIETALVHIAEIAKRYNS